MKVVFLGTPEIAVPSLQKLIDAPDIEVLAVITQPDKPVGRKQVITPPPIKVLAKENQIPVFQPERISKDLELVEHLKSLNPDVLTTVAYGQILRENILKLAPYGVVNLHVSLLPKYRGPAPINWMIINGEDTVGVCTMNTVLEVDAGDVLMTAKSRLGENESAQDLAERMSFTGADLLLETLQNIKDITPQEQVYPEDHNPETSLAPFMDKKLGEIDFGKTELIYKSANPKQSSFKVTKKNSAQNIHNLVRGTYPWPGAYFWHKDQKIIILRTEVDKDCDLLNTAELSAGQIVKIDKQEESFSIATQEGILKFLELKPQGKGAMSATAWLNGAHLQAMDSL